MVVNKNIVLGLGALGVAAASYLCGKQRERALLNERVSILKNDIKNMHPEELESGDFSKQYADLIIEALRENDIDIFYIKAGDVCQHIIDKLNAEAQERYRKEREADMAALKEAEEEASESEEE